MICELCWFIVDLANMTNWQNGKKEGNGQVTENISVVVVVGKSGRITIPTTIRNDLGIKEGDALRVSVVDGVLQIKKLGE